MSTLTTDRSDDLEVVGPPDGRRLRIALLTVIALGALVIAAGAGFLLRGSPSATTPGTASVDAGFARDMATHHTQAVTMAGIERDATTNASLRLLAFDIETGQEMQVGQMEGWLDAWNLSRNSPDPMSWMHGMHMSMGADGLMPGMATEAQLARLRSLRGSAQDILFLQLMIHHHQGGIPMAQYAAAHADTEAVRTLAGHMVAAQNAEIIEMERLLRQLGGTPLAPPS